MIVAEIISGGIITAVTFIELTYVTVEGEFRCLRAAMRALPLNPATLKGGRTF